MAATEGMETYSTRLESFGVSRQGKKGNSKGSKSQQWPLTQPTPDQLAQAGFYFDPTPTSPDNVKCFLCLKSLDGWESEDDAVKEHANFSPDCGFAIHALIEQNVESGIRDHEDPMSERMIEARKATFGDKWPYEKKRGWTCKTQKMVDAGWYYCPTADSDDFVKCAYCGLSLDGWEPKDKPFDEHQRRSPQCHFFLTEHPPKTKSRAKKGMASKASRASIQSTATTLEELSMNDATNVDDSIMTTATDKGKKAPRAKKGKAKSKTSTAPVTLTSSFIEPEDDDFEVKVVAAPQKSTRGKKRKSGEIQEETSEATAPAPKRRATRTRSSTVKPETPASDPQPQADGDIVMGEPTEKNVVAEPKKAKKVGRPRASSKARNASAQSIASTASLRADGITDAEIDAALEADLENPHTEQIESTIVSKSAKRERAVSKTKKTKASAASARQIVDDDQIREAVVDTTNVELSMVTADESLQSIAPIKNPKQRVPKVTKKRTASKPVMDIHIDEDAETQPDAGIMEPPNIEEEDLSAAPKPRKGKGRQPSRKASRQVSRAKAKKIVPAPASSSEGAAATAEVVVDRSVSIQPVEELQEEAPKPKRGRKPGSTNKTKKSKVSTAKDQKKREEPAMIAIEPVSGNELDDIDAVAELGLSNEVEENTVLGPEQQTFTTMPPRVFNAAESVPDQGQAPTTKKAAASDPQQMPSPTPSPQASDAENQPPSSRPSDSRPPLAPVSPTTAAGRIRTDSVTSIVEASTPTGPRTGADPKLASTFPWTAVDVEQVFGPEKENILTAELTSPEKRMTVEQWVQWGATQAHERLRAECERVVGRFESEGVRALKSLEGVVVMEE